MLQKDVGLLHTNNNCVSFDDTPAQWVGLKVWRMVRWTDSVSSWISLKPHFTSQSTATDSGITMMGRTTPLMFETLHCYTLCMIFLPSCELVSLKNVL